MGNGNYLTPIHQLSYNDGKNNYYMKREDLLPFSFGGNKVRIAQKYFEDMERKKCDCIIAYGNSRSNLCRVIANMSKLKGIPCYVISPADDSGERYETNNSIIVKKTGAKIIPCLKTNVSQTVASVIEECKSKGLNPYYIYGDMNGKGNEKIAVQAYAEVFKEIKKQEKDLNLFFDYIFLACGTGTTLAGLICGSLSYSNECEIIGISIARDKEHSLRVVTEYVEKYMEMSTNEWGKIIKVVDDWQSGGYGQYNNSIVQSIEDVLLNDGIPLDTTYTGKAFWGMKEYIHKHDITDANILFIHTGGLPLFFDNLKSLLGVKK
ncbi:pyridoxal-phosphate dependent enzyme [Bacillus sp. 37MA]|uniref:1-aminocyclopropane-1-carboxylate deaminase/D-cysteine desulfhydrase n=1 Tax=Bacillus sp. 37MA TaxID=1132442 RepID=UPI0003739C7A|nr:pyridoxal-phosphate dependent enzyme [Bacillus sp. 37MA]